MGDVDFPCTARGLRHVYATSAHVPGPPKGRGGGHGGGRQHRATSGDDSAKSPHSGALNGIDLELEAGRVTAVQGPNGSGKSTLLRVLAGLLAPSEGRVRLLGIDQPARSSGMERCALRQRTAYLDQGLTLDPEMTGEETLELLAALHGARPDTAELARAFELGSAIGRPVADWSGGQRRRLHLAGALLGGTEVLFVDEPSAGLDADGQDRLWQLLRARAGAGAAVVVVSHDQQRIRRHADRVIRMEAGKIIGDGPPSAPESSTDTGSGKGAGSATDRSTEENAREDLEAASRSDRSGSRTMERGWNLALGRDPTGPKLLPVLGSVCKRTWIKTLRRPVTLTFSLVQPLVWMGFFGFLFERYELSELGDSSYIDFLAPGVCAMTVLFGASQSGIGWIRDYQTGFLGRMLTTPASPTAILGGKVLADILRLLAQAGAVLLLALALGAELRFTVALVPGLTALLLFALGFSALSCAIALRTRAQEAMAAFVHVVNMPLLFTSTALVPQRQMPDWLQTLAAANPLSHAVDALRGALLFSDVPAVGSLAFLAGAAALLFGLATHEIRRLQKLG